MAVGLGPSRKELFPPSCLPEQTKHGKLCRESAFGISDKLNPHAAHRPLMTSGASCTHPTHVPATELTLPALASGPYECSFLCQVSSPALLPHTPNSHSSSRSQQKNHLGLEAFPDPSLRLPPAGVATPLCSSGPDFSPLLAHISRVIIACVPVGSLRKGTVSYLFLYL